MSQKPPGPHVRTGLCYARAALALSRHEIAALPSTRATKPRNIEPTRVSYLVYLPDCDVGRRVSSIYDATLVCLLHRKSLPREGRNLNFIPKGFAKFPDLGLELRGCPQRVRNTKVQLRVCCRLCTSSSRSVGSKGLVLRQLSLSHINNVSTDPSQAVLVAFQCCRSLPSLILVSLI